MKVTGDAESAGDGRTASVRTVVMVGFEGFQLLDVTGPLEVFSQATRLLGESDAAQPPAYRLIFSADEAGAVGSSCGLGLVAHCAWHELPEVDTLLVAGGAGVRSAMNNPELIGWLKSRAPRSRRFGSVCTGALILAQAGLLEERRVTTHWQHMRELAQLAPTARVAQEAIFVRDRNLWTSAGVLAGMDMALAMVAEDWGKPLALRVAQRLVMYLQRTGMAAQRGAPLEAQAMAAAGRFGQLSDWIVQHIGEDLSVTCLAARAQMSPRHFARRFRDELGVSPAKFIEQLRYDAARQALADDGGSVEEIAYRCGFGCAETLRRVFHRRLGIGPSAYRRRVHGGEAS